MFTPKPMSSELPLEINTHQVPMSPVRRDVQQIEECRKAFEEKCRFMRTEWSLEWDKAGFYAQLETDRAYTWFKLGFDQAKSIQSTPLAS